jgi:hypothetical protein
MSILKDLIARFKRLNTPRKISISLFISFILIAQITSIICAIGILNFSQLLSNIKIPSGYVYVNLDIYSPNDMAVEIPYDIENAGAFDLTHIELSINLHLNYINESNHANITSHVFSKTSLAPRCRAFSTLSENFVGTFPDFLIPPLVEFFDNSDEFEMVYYLMDINLRAKYFYGLINFQFAENNLNLSQI